MCVLIFFISFHNILSSNCGEGLSKFKPDGNSILVDRSSCNSNSNYNSIYIDLFFFDFLSKSAYPEVDFNLKMRFDY